jgi:hypothetical protein
MFVVSVATSCFLRFYNFHLRIHGHICCFRGNDLVSKILDLSFAYPWTRLFNTQRGFVPKNRMSAETCLPIGFLEAAYISQWIVNKLDSFD